MGYETILILRHSLLMLSRPLLSESSTTVPLKPVTRFISPLMAKIPVYNNVCELSCGRIRDLPEHEREAFLKRLEGQTRPLVEGLSMEDQDYFYMCDYFEWKMGLPVMD